MPRCRVIVLSLSLLKKTQALPYRLGVILGSVHFFLALGWSILIYQAMAKDSEAVMGLLPLYFVDVPASLLTVPVSMISEKLIGYNFMATNFYIPCTIFVLFGSLQYILLGLGTGALYRKVFH